jgi:hypothetical protein
MTSPHGLIADLTAHVARGGTRPPAVRAARRWATRRAVLAPYPHPVEVARAGLAADPGGQDRLLSALLDVGAPDEWAELTVLAILSPHLSRVVNYWGRHGATRCELVDLEADLVAECWTVIRRVMADGPCPDHPGLALPDRARLAVRNRRTTEIRRAGRTSVDGPPDVGWIGDPRSSAGLLAAAISEATAAGVLGAGPARAVFLTRVIGLSPTEAATRMGTAPGSVRALRSRGAHRLTTHLGLEPATTGSPHRPTRAGTVGAVGERDGMARDVVDREAHRRAGGLLPVVAHRE